MESWSLTRKTAQKHELLRTRVGGEGMTSPESYYSIIITLALSQISYPYPVHPMACQILPILEDFSVIPEQYRGYGMIRVEINTLLRRSSDAEIETCFLEHSCSLFPVVENTTRMYSIVRCLRSQSQVRLLRRYSSVLDMLLLAYVYLLGLIQSK